jgi:hypothetical protein
MRSCPLNWSFDTPRLPHPKALCTGDWEPSVGKEVRRPKIVERRMLRTKFVVPQIEFKGEERCIERDSGAFYWRRCLPLG